MTANTTIEWADHTFNPWIGCTRVSPGCDHCYAAVSTPARTLHVTWGNGAARHRTSGDTWGDPVRWNKKHAEFFATHGRRQRVFCASLADVFDNQVPAEWRADLFEVIRTTPNLDWLLLTKRPQNIVRMVHESGAVAGNGTRYLPENVWLGATCEDQRRADQNIMALLRTKPALGARVLFVSMEPLLESVQLWRLKALDFQEDSEGAEVYPLRGLYAVPDCDWPGPKLDWVIVGGESGARARPMHPDWVRSLRDQCEAAGVPFLFKQWGEFLPASADAADPSIADVPDARLFWSDGAKWDRFDGQRSGVDLVARVGKKAAGRLLDGVTHDCFPGGAA